MTKAPPESAKDLRPDGATRQDLRDLPALQDILERYSAPVPRYTSYPAATVWRDDFSTPVARDILESAGSTGPLSLYVHLPFCKKLCHYCGCTMMVTRSEELVDAYLGALEQEISEQAALACRSPVVQLHLGGGTPTFLTSAQLRRLFGALSRAYTFAPAAELSIEVHPPVTTDEQMATLADLGFNRVSMGVQDFDPDVQRAVNRIQPFEQTRHLIEHSRRLGFQSVNVDLMYGLPLQTPESLARTLDQVELLRPDRIALFGYAHVPAIKKHQQRLEQFGLPGPADRLQLFQQSTRRLLEMGYAFIGLDHFALPDDELVRARANGTLHRSFMGYTTCAQADLIGLGASSISDVGGAYLQNTRDVRDYIRRVADGGLAITRGWLPSEDDHIRRAVLQDLFCNLRLDCAEFDAREGVDSRAYLASEMLRLAPFQDDGLVRMDGASITVTPTGQFLLRNIASVFDAHLAQVRATAPALSQSV